MMVLNRLVWSSYTRHTHYDEEGLRIRIVPRDDERVLFFHTDTPDGRQALGLRVDHNICDAVVFYRGPSNIPVFLLAELKSCCYSHAITQIQQTYDAIRRHYPSDFLPGSRSIALLVMTAGSPPDQARLERNLARPDLRIIVRSGRKNRPLDIREFLN
jgi:hypothetical protein